MFWGKHLAEGYSMFNKTSLEKNLKENIRNYNLSSLYDIDSVKAQIIALSTITGVGILITNRHGDANISAGWNQSFSIDVDSNPGIKLQIMKRTMAHIYLDYSELKVDRDLVQTMVDTLIAGYTKAGSDAYELRETHNYIGDKEGVEDLKFVRKDDKCDPLTGVLNKAYFDNRVKIMDRSQLVPVATICININDWKFVNDNYGDDESDRLIKVIAQIVASEAKTDYVIGRVDGDVFNVLISMPLDGEVDDFCNRVRERCITYNDERLAPSVAIGYAIKENVEQALDDLYSDAEYMMFENKIDVKNEAGYRERLEHGLK